MTGMMVAFQGASNFAGSSSAYTVTVYYATFSPQGNQRFNSGYLGVGYGSITPTTYFSNSQAAQFTVSSLYALGAGDGSSGSCTLSLVLTGSVVPNQNAFTYVSVGGSVYNATDATYKAGYNSSSWAWTAASNPFGTTANANISVAIT